MEFGKRAIIDSFWDSALDEFENDSEKEKSIDYKIWLICNKRPCFRQDNQATAWSYSTFRSISLWIELLWDSFVRRFEGFIEKNARSQPCKKNISFRNYWVFRAKYTTKLMILYVFYTYSNPAVISIRNFTIWTDQIQASTKMVRMAIPKTTKPLQPKTEYLLPKSLSTPFILSKA